MSPTAVRQTKEWKAPCKGGCGKMFGYSDLSQQKMADYANNIPLYCDDCRARNKREKATMGVSYFNMSLKSGISLDDIQPGPLGIIYHPELTHVSTETPSGFDESMFGLTPNEMKKISDWFLAPEHQVVVVEGPTGSGKSTALPNWLMYPPKGLPQNQYLRHGQILITQPRIVATVGIAGFVGGTLIGGTVGKGFDIGYSHSKSRSTDWRNSMVYRTDGQLLNLITRDDLDGLSVIMIDEAHERSLNIDLILRLLKEKLPLFPNLKLIIASATINAQMFKDYYGDHTATVVSLAGKSVFGYGDPNFAQSDEALSYEDANVLRTQVGPKLVKKIKWLIDGIRSGSKKPGDILGFLQGVQYIEDAVKALQSWANQDKEAKIRVEVYPLYSVLSKKEQEVIQRANNDPKLIRVILSTNIAEASVTVDGVVYIVDSGVENQSRWNPKVGTTEIKTVRTSRANCKQRWGRCGRNRPGEVYCLYTKEQYDDDQLFDNYPTPEIHRANLEPVLLSAKSAGVDDIFDGWLENPPEEELKRSLEILKEKGALSEEEYLTEYGVIIKYFSYPVELADFIILADRLGCVVEIATLLPFIKHGGSRFFLQWDKDWGRYKKQRAARVHKELMRGCKDDVEFILKIFKAYEEMPWITYPKNKGLTKSQQHAKRVQWAEDNFIDYEVIEAIIKTERPELLDRLFTRRKSQTYRDIELKLLDKVRFLLMWAFPDQHANIISEPNPDEYEFNFHQEKLPESLFTINTLLTADALRSAKKLTDKNIFKIAEAVSNVKIEEGEPKDVWERLFLEQHYPLGSTVLCEPVSTVTKVCFERQVHVRILKLEKMPTTKSRKAKRNKKSKPVPKGFHKVLNSIASLFADKSVMGSLIDGSKVSANVVGYSFYKGEKPTVFLASTDSFTTFDFFVEKYTVEDELEVEVMGLSSYPLEYGQHLIVKDTNLGHEILMDVTELCFGFERDALDEIPVGTKFKVLVSEINKKERYIKVSALYFYQQWFDQIVEENSSRGYGMTSGRVITVRSDGKVSFLLDWSVPEKALLVPVTASANSLFQSNEEFLLGNSHTVKFWTQRKKPYRVSLDRLPKKAQSFLQGKDESDGVFWDEKQNDLCFKGRMDDETYLDLKSLAKDEAFQKASDKLFGLSNRIVVSEVIDTQAIEAARAEMDTDSVFTYTIKNTSKFGLFVQVSEGVEGYIHVKQIYGYVEDASKVYESGETVRAKIMHFDETRGRFELTMKIPENDPMNKYLNGMGKVFPATIANAMHFGVFMRLEDGVDGLLHKTVLSGAQFVGMTTLASTKSEKKFDVRIIKIEERSGKTVIGLELA